MPRKLAFVRCSEITFLIGNVEAALRHLCLRWIKEDLCDQAVVSVEKLGWQRTQLELKMHMKRLYRIVGHDTCISLLNVFSENFACI